MINYMDRQVLANMSERISKQLSLSETQYGNVEWAFGTAFAVGSLAFGFLVDRIHVRLLYPAVLLAWSGVGFITGFVWDYPSLLVCRLLLGFFEAGHWPCAMTVTYAILAKEDRAFGNSILQSGASIGAIVTPLLIMALFAVFQDAESWRSPFQVVGCIGVLWAVAWLIAIPHGSLQRRSQKQSQGEFRVWIFDLLRNPKFWALAIMIFSINTSWQLIRAWLPKFLQQGRGYSESAALLFNSVYYIATDVGCLCAGWGAACLCRNGRSVHASRMLVYSVSAMLAGLTCLAAVLPQSWVLLLVLLLVGTGALGVFPCYYSFSQELSTSHLGKATGLLAFLGWLASSPVHRLFGSYVDKTHSFDLGIALVGLAPLLGLFAMLILWPSEQERSVEERQVPSA
jgi:ACS family hexuronate transporter-like MFS transporter